MDSSRRLSIQELCTLSGKSERTIRFYISKELLESPGMGARGGYPLDSLDRLRLVAKFQKEGKTLDDIAELLKAMEPDELARHAVSAPPELSSAADYIAELNKGEEARGAARTVASIAAPLGARWVRYALNKNMELNVREPIDASRKRQIERLLRSAARILSEESQEPEEGHGEH